MRRRARNRMIEGEASVVFRGWEYEVCRGGFVGRETCFAVLRLPRV